MSSDTLSTTGTLDASTLSASTAATASTATSESSPSSSSSSSSFDNDPELRLAEIDQYYRRPEIPPRVVHVLPDPAPYAQLCFRRADSSTTTTTKEKPTDGRLYILMVGSKQTPTKVCCSRKYKPLVEDDDHYFGETPVLGQASSSQSSSSDADSSAADVLVLEDLGWASNGWDDLRRTSLSSVSTTSQVVVVVRVPRTTTTTTTTMAEKVTETVGPSGRHGRIQVRRRLSGRIRTG